MKIRKAGPDDFPQLVFLFEEIDRLHREALPHIFRQPPVPFRTEAYLEKVLADDNALLLVAEAKDELAGLALVFAPEAKDIPLLVPRRTAFIDTLVVKETFRRRGIGRQLLEAVEKWSRTRGVDLLELNVWQFNKKARAFYQNTGFETASFRMWKRLERIS